MSEIPPKKEPDPRQKTRVRFSKGSWQEWGDAHQDPGRKSQCSVIDLITSEWYTHSRVEKVCFRQLPQKLEALTTLPILSTPKTWSHANDRNRICVQYD